MERKASYLKQPGRCFVEALVGGLRFWLVKTRFQVRWCFYPAEVSKAAQSGSFVRGKLCTSYVLRQMYSRL